MGRAWIHPFLLASSLLYTGLLYERTPGFSMNELHRRVGMSASQVAITMLPATAPTTRPQRASVSVRGVAGGRGRPGWLPIAVVESAFRMLRVPSMRSAGCLSTLFRSGGADGVAGLVCSGGATTSLMDAVVSAMLDSVGISHVFPRMGSAASLSVRFICFRLQLGAFWCEHPASLGIGLVQPADFDGETSSLCPLRAFLDPRLKFANLTGAWQRNHRG
jgi:hypothetical protein